MDNSYNEVTCLICGECGGHTHRQHYSTLKGIERPAAIQAAQKRIEAATGRWPKLGEVMELFGVRKKDGAK